MKRKGISLPRILIAGAESGSGKTMISCALLKIFKEERGSVAAFKCGPDYIDPMFHTKVTGVPSRNLDAFFCNEEQLNAVLYEAKEKADCALIEGVMGYYDGLGGTSLTASAYDVAVKTGSPVLLVMDAAGMSRSVIASLKGYIDYESGIGNERRIKGVLFNRLPAMLFPEIKRLTEEECGISCVGYLPKLSVSWGSRHLGLLRPQEIASLGEQLETFCQKMRETLDLPLLYRIMEEAPPIGETAFAEAFLPDIRERYKDIRIGVARDDAFCFIYEDNLRLLKELGAEIVFFSPLEDRKLPEADGLIFPGGYPELHAEQLAANETMKAAIRNAAEEGMPVLAECGGFMYLQERMRSEEGNHKMCGVLEGESFPTGRLVRFGYVTIRTDKGEAIRGHEFHYYDSTNNGELYTAVKPASGKEYACMTQKNNVIAGFSHLYYPSCPEFAVRFLDACATYKKDRRMT